MDESPQSSPPLDEASLLTEFEKRHIPAHYREYYLAKRNNLFATIVGYPQIWKTYTALDSIWERGIHDLNVPTRLNELLPLLLYLAAHAKVRTSIELALTACLGEARSILRDAIEYTAHAHRMRVSPELQAVWTSKEDNEKAFSSAFEKNKKGNLFQGLEELHQAWGTLSEIGAHATPASLSAQTIFTTRADGGYDAILNYSGSEPKTLIPAIFSMLLTCSTIENTFYGDFRERLSLDYVLVQQRREFVVMKESVRLELIRHFDIKPPVDTSANVG